MILSITLVIIIVTVIVSLYAFENGDVKYKLLFNPYSVIHQKKWYKTISHAFIHADFMHLFFNMYVLYLFGNLVEGVFLTNYRFGITYYIVLYFGGILFATIPAFYKHSDNVGYNSLGASGAVSAVLFATIVINPGMSLYLFFVPIPIPAVVFGPLYLFYEYYMGKKGRTNIAHDAHFAGAVFGIIFTLILDFNYFINNFINQISLLIN
jgi:membrane associated rhomboid family serine protease